MSVTKKHKDYDKYKEKWGRCRDVIEGEDAVKAAGVAYLPKLGGQTDSEYTSYKMRAMFFGASSRTLSGLVGAIFRKDPTFEIQKGKEEELKHVTSEGIAAVDFLKKVVTEVLTTDRYGILTDMDKKTGTKQRAYLQGYPAESITNWNVKTVDGQEILQQVVLEEIYEEPGKDEFEIKEKTQYRVLKLNEGLYEQEIWRKKEIKTAGKDEWEISDTLYPSFKGRRLTLIPFKFVNSTDSTSAVGKPPLLDLVNVNLSHYRSSADLEHGRHFTALPTAWVAGFPKDTKLKIGSTIAWVSEDPQANAGYLEYTGQGLGAIENALSSKEKLMAVLGARILEEERRQVETAESQVVRRVGENSVLASLSKAVSTAVSESLKYWADWSNITNEVNVDLNTDYVAATMAPEMLTALMSLRQTGEMSKHVFFHNLKKGEMYPDEWTEEEEAGAITVDGPTLIGEGIDLDDEKEKEDGTE